MRQLGFTLLEVLVGLVVLGLIITGLSQGMYLGLRVANLQDRVNDQRDALGALDRSLRLLIAQTDPGSPQNGFTLQGTSDRVALVTALPNAGVTEAAVEIGMSPGDRLVLHWTPHIHAKHFGPAPPSHEIELFSGLKGLEIAYWDQGWRHEWHEAAPPDLIRLRLTFPPGTNQHWPDIVARPIRSRPD